MAELSRFLRESNGGGKSIFSIKRTPLQRSRIKRTPSRPKSGRETPFGLPDFSPKSFSDRFVIPESKKPRPKPLPKPPGKEDIVDSGGLTKDPTVPAKLVKSDKNLKKKIETCR